MKTLLTIFACLMMALLTQAQTPQLLKYQAVVRDNSGNVLSNQSVGFRLSIRTGSPSGTIVYRETQTLTTNAFGLANLNIGGGTPLIGTFSLIDWTAGSKYLEVELDPNGGSSYVSMGVSQMLSVPFALYSENTANVNDADADPLNEIQYISKSGSTVSLSNGGGFFTDETADADADPGNEFQTITKSGNTVSLSDGGGSFQDAVDDADPDPVNEIQLLTKTGNQLTLSNGGGTVTDEVNDIDADTLNEIQVLSKTGNLISLSNGGGTIPDDVDDLDADPGNELQTLSLTGQDLTITNGNSVTLPTELPPGTTGQTLFHNGSIWDASPNLFNNGSEVGIGNPNPQMTLDVDGGVRVTSGFVPSSGTGGELLFNPFGWTSTLVLDAINRNTDAMQDVAINGLNLRFGTGSTGIGLGVDRMVINSSGNVGIGTSSPGYKLDVAGNMNFTGNIYKNGSLFDFGWPTGSPGQTIYYNGTNWVSSSNLFHDGASVGIGNSPSSSAILDVSSTTKGMLVPRMTSAQRNGIATPTNGLLLYDTDTQTFWYYQNTAWIELIGTGNNSGLSDADGNTQVQVEELPNEDKIRFDMAGTEFFVMDNGRLEVRNTGRSVFIGIRAGVNDDLSENHNDFIGYYAGEANITGENNTANGYFSMRFNSSGNFNSAYGAGSLQNNIGGINNTALGASTLYTNTFGLYNTATGYSALYNNNGNGNTASGFHSLNDNTSGEYNVASGYYSLHSNTTGKNNAAFGKEALFSNTTGYSNVAMGVGSLFSNTDRSNLVAIGDSALYYNGTGATINWQGTDNTAVGSKALYANTTGSLNVAIGPRSLFSNTSGTRNTAIGDSALYSNNYGDDNTAIGVKALHKNYSGGWNTAIGPYSLFKNYDGDYNVAIGPEALENNYSGWYNIAIGYLTLYDNYSGTENSAIGYGALRYNYSGNDNTAIGEFALEDNVSGNNNSALGVSALQSIEGSYNTAQGYEAVINATSGYYNTAIGSLSLHNLTVGSENTVIGDNGWPVGTTTYSNYTGIGYFVGTGVANPSNRVEIGNSSVTWIGGSVGWLTYSDKKIKKKIKEDVPGLDFIGKLRPVSYNIDLRRENEILYGGKEKEMADWPEKYAIEQIRMTGFIAQEVEAAAHDCDYDFSGVRPSDGEHDLYTLSYSQFVVPLVKAVQEQQEIIDKLYAENKEFRARLELLENRQISTKK